MGCGQEDWDADAHLLGIWQETLLAVRWKHLLWTTQETYSKRFSSQILWCEWSSS